MQGDGGGWSGEACVRRERDIRVEVVAQGPSRGRNVPIPRPARSHTLQWYWSSISARLPSLRVLFSPHNVLIHRNVSHFTICSMMGLPCYYTCKKTAYLNLDIVQRDQFSVRRAEEVIIVRFHAVQVNRKWMKKQRTLINHRPPSHSPTPTPVPAWIHKNYILFISLLPRNG